MANTHIQILRSYATTSPALLKDGELAYSFLSNTMFIGDHSTDIIKVGGQYYTNIIDTSTAINTPSTIVLRDTNGVANLIIAAVDGGIF